MRLFCTAGRTVVTPCVTSCEGPHPARGQSQPGGLTPVAVAMRVAGPPSSLGGGPGGMVALPWGAEQGPQHHCGGQGGRRAAHHHGNGTSCGDAHRGRVFFIFFPLPSSPSARPRH